MTNEVIAAILDHLCNQARNAAHATFGLIELLRDADMDSVGQTSMALGTASADQLLRSIDDVRDLLSGASPAPAALEEFDLSLCAGEIVEALSLASGRQARHMVLDAPREPLLVTQDRKAVEQMFTRLLNTAFNLGSNAGVHVELSSGSAENAVRLAISGRDADLAARFAMWLNADPDKFVLQDPSEIPLGIALMVAGKHLRELGGSAELLRVPGGPEDGRAAVVIELPSRAREAGDEGRESPHSEPRPEALNVLVAEDCDDSFALSELLLRNEHVWRARDGCEALRIIQQRRFDVVFMDVHMPGMDGYSAIRGIRNWETETGNARTPMVVLSSDDLETQRRSAAQCGCSGFLRKPLRRGDLNTLLDRLKAARSLVA